MPRLLPIDLVNAQFSKASFGGYKHDEVNDLVDRAASALEELAAENEDLRAKVVRLQADLDEMRGEERLVKEAIVSAQRAAELLRADATREADLIREEARQQARAERSQAQKDADALKEEVDRLATARKRYLGEHRALLERSLRELAEIDPPAPTPAPTQAVVPMPVSTPEPSQGPTQMYPTRLPAGTKPLEPVVTQPTIVEDETGEKWVS